MPKLQGMSFAQQLRAAIRGQIEDFFRVPWQSVVVWFVVIACLVEVSYLRTVYGNSGPWFWRQMALLCVVIWLLSRQHPKP